jgi:ribosome biogenesis SPOUT family RNA methylase Rps3
MSRRPDVVVPPNATPEMRQVLLAISQRLAALEEDAATKAELARAGVIRIDSNGAVSAVVRPQDARNNQR